MLLKQIKIRFTTMPAVVRETEKGLDLDRWTTIRPQRETDPEQLLKDFLNCPREEIVAFHERYGVFDGGRHTSFSEFQEWQSLLREIAERTQPLSIQVLIRLNERHDPLKIHQLQTQCVPLNIHFWGHPDDRNLYGKKSPGYTAVVEAKTVLEAIIACVKLGKVRAAAYQRCAREGCDITFQPRDPRQVFCDAYCGGRVRKERYRKKQRKPPAKNRTAPTHVQSGRKKGAR